MAKRIQSSSSAYVWDFSGAAAYLGLSRKGFWRVRNSGERTEEEKRLLTPRIVNRRPCFSKANLDLFMSPALNAPNAKAHDPFSP